MRLHDDEIVSTPDLVHRLVAAQLPQWSGLPVRPGPAGGTDHHLFRLGDELLVRMPKIAWAQDQAVADARWLPHLAAHLPVELPVPVAVGEPGEGFPFRWSVVPWLEGEPPAPGSLGADGVRGLGELVAALRTVPAGGGPVKEGTSRGVPLARLDDDVRAAIAASGTRVDGPAVTKAWDRALDARPTAEARWLHGDLLPGNLLTRDGRLTGVIDWGAVGVGDPAADLIPAWGTGLTDAERAVFRAAATDGLADPDDAWERGRGWMLVQAVIALPYYWDRWPAFARAGQARIATVLAG
ncbi:aminoglycoside phosphotransferase family protein [Promicromonospora sp. NPDC090134]|uniref:aminoglycoside phosphotransferase family protein n=1 Tax=Promicromonospora sp. NPDC090134 TaxID=3364408 RepID=UPI00382826CD